jgi:hypothetical protein
MVGENGRVEASKVKARIRGMKWTEREMDDPMSREEGRKTMGRK